MVHRDLPLNQISLDPHQPRKDLGNLDGLAAKIWDRGLLHAVVVTEQTPTAYVLLAGERRLTCFQRNRERAEVILAAPDDHSPDEVQRALAYSSWTVVPSQIWPDDPPPFLRQLIQIDENDTNKPLSLMERADGYVQAAASSGLNVKDFCAAAGIGRSVFYAFRNCSQAKGPLREALLDGTIVDVSVVHYFRQLPLDTQTALVEGARKDGAPLTRSLVQDSLAGVQKARSAAAATSHLKPESDPDSTKEGTQSSDHDKAKTPSDHPALDVASLEWLVELLSALEPDPKGHRDHALEVFSAALDRSSPLLLLEESWGERRSRPLNTDAQEAPN